MTRSNGRLRDERDQDGAPPGGVRWSGVRPRPTVSLLEQLDQLERADPCRNIEDIWKRYRPAVWARLQRPTIPEDVAEVISDNYFCRLATTTSAGGSAVRTACATVRS
jgi:hypothetical protein